MPDHRRPGDRLTGSFTVAAAVAAVACCAFPLLVAAGLVTTAGVALRSVAVVGVGVALATWLVVRAVRRQRRRDTSDPAPPEATRRSEANR